MKIQEDKVYLPENESKNTDSKYVFVMQKFIDTAENIKDVELKKEIIYQMLQLEKVITSNVEEKVREQLKKDICNK